MRPLLPRAARALSVAALALGLACAGSFTAPALAQTQPTAAQPAAPAKPFARDDVASDAVRLPDTLRKETREVAQGKSAAQLAAETSAALAAKDVETALKLAGAAIAVDPAPAAAWLAYARLILRGALPDGQAYVLRERATVAAYAAYQRAQTPVEKSAALALLSQAYEAREMWRDALDSSAAALALHDDAGLRQRHAKLRAEHGFRILEYTVDSDAASPRICFSFSDPLAKRADFSPYVAVAGASSTALSVEDQQICVDGLSHGQSYKMTLRQGLPSTVGESLLRDANYDIHVRDRSAQARFTGKNYVLPRVGQEGLPVVTVNASRVAIDLYRIGERGLAPTLRGEDFLKQISGYRADKLAQDEGVKVWSGTLDVASELNKEVTTAFPVLDAVKTLEPGVYVMTARVDGAASDEEYQNRATQWFIVSDIGLSALSGADGITAIARSLATAEPKAGVDLKLVARNNEILASARTDENGVARFDPGLSRGTGGLAPGVLVASDAGGDHGFLDMGASAFDLADRGVSGRAAPKGLDAMVFAERGVYRPGETVYLTTLLRDAKGVAAAGPSLTLAIKRPDGVDYKRVIVEDQGAGGRAFALPLLGDAPTGSWKAQVFADPKGAAIGETSFLVEDYTPERLDVKVAAKQPSLAQGEAARLDVSADYLYGAPGAGLEISGEAKIEAVEGGALAGWPGYVAGVTDETFETATGEVVGEKTDAKGRATVTATLPRTAALRPLQAKIALRVGEAGGRAVERVTTLPIRAAAGVVGVKKTFGDLSEGSTATFDVIALDAAGARVAARGAGWTLLKVETRYQWAKSDGQWGFESVKTTKKIASGALDIPADAPAHVSTPVGWGGYRLDVISAEGATTSVAFEAGWSGDATADTPDLLPITLDKKTYASGETAKLTVESRAAGKGFVAIVSDGVKTLTPITLAQGGTTIEIPVKADWGAGAYALVSAHRPLDAAAKRMPGRAVGVAWFGIDAASRTLDVTIATPDKTRPRGPLSVPVKLGGLAPGEEAYVVVSAVDVGILQLTRYETPKPVEYFFGQRQLSTEMRDLYGYLIDGMQGARGAIRSGGDGSGPGLEGNRPTQEPLARYSGVIKVAPNGMAEARFDLPAFNGAVRVSAAAWTKTRAGAAQADVIVRDAVVAQATLPRFLSIGDKSRLHVRFDNVEGASGDYVARVDLRGPLAAPADALTTTLALAKGGSSALSIPVTATGVGRGEVEVTLSGPDFSAAQTLALNVSSGTSDIQRRSVRSLAPGESATISGELLADYLPGTGKVSVSLSPFGSIDATALLAALDRYPYGCTEQTVSRALPLLYVNQVAALARAALDGDAQERVRAAIERVLSRQDSNGAFGLWSAGGNEDHWLDAYALDFLTRSREQGYDVPQRAMDLGLERLRNFTSNISDADRGDGASLAYSLYVLARNGRPVAGDLRYLADTQRDAFKTALGRAQIGAALALIGDKPRAGALFETALERLARTDDAKVSRDDYGSRLRDGAGALTLIAETGGGGDALQRADAVVGQAQANQSYASTQEQGWLVMAAQAMAKAADGFAWEAGGRSGKGAYAQSWREDALAAGPTTIVNRAGAPATLVVTSSGNPIVPEPAAAQGYGVERAMYRLDGTPVQGAAKQNERVVVVLKVTEREARRAKLLLVDKLPAGLEIDNPKLVESGSLDGLAWLTQEVEPTHSEYRDDRFVAAFNRDGGDQATFSVAYIVRAVTPGVYVLPPAQIEDMYRPERFGRTAYGSFEVTAP
jgi:hypothetical protein